MNIKKTVSVALILCAMCVGMILNAHAELCSSTDSPYVVYSSTNYLNLIVDAAMEKDYELAKQYTDMRNQKIEFLGLEDTYNQFEFDDLFMLTVICYQECGSYWSTDDEILGICNLVQNRVVDPRFADNIKDVLETKGQFGFWYKPIDFPNRGNSQLEQDAKRRCYYIAARALNNERCWNGYEFMPEGVVYEKSCYPVGKVWWYAPNGTMFCFS